jgi:hypothetical protein
MHRFIVGLIAAGALLVATVAISMTVTGDLKQAATAEASAAAGRGAALVQRWNHLEAVEFTAAVSEAARSERIAAALAATEETQRREKAFAECQGIKAELGSQGRAVDMVAVLDAAGKVVARDLNPNANYGEDMAAKFAPVAQALKGKSASDILPVQGGRGHRVAVAPVAGTGGGVAGALLVAYALSDQNARAVKDVSGLEVAIFHDNKLQTTSFTNAEGATDGSKLQALSPVVLEGDGLAKKALSAGKATEVATIEVDGAPYAATAVPFLGNASDKTSGAVVLAAMAPGLAAAAAAGQKIWILGLLAILVALVASVMTAKRFIKPLDQIELGVAEIINGNIDYLFKPVGPDFEGLSNGLNVMLARLLGREEPSEDQVDDEDVQKWKAEQMVIEEADGNPAGANVQALAQENEAAYYPRLFGEYVNALRNTGVRADGVSVQSFTAKLRLTEGGLKRKWNCRMVRFQLAASGEKIVFQAVRIP